ncbi:hypothetical protein [Haladaptatus sp. AB643]|uniref:hypothetical protein n=1 Tax=Haladaptatus sp. AB643 TaxID=2934174 RepID=UPI00209C2B8D|nr:hypothetical protein [Haladaptatus sp. AB643]MCO8245333.1 hypothetical protein [Haladaptatus sp. AB643]
MVPTTGQHMTDRNLAELGFEDLWKNEILRKYIDGELSREEAIELVGLENVQRADRETAVVEEDVDWGLDA